MHTYQSAVIFSTQQQYFRLTDKANIGALGREDEEQEEHEEEHASRLHISGALSLRHPGGLEVLQGAGLLLLCARRSAVVPGRLLEGVVCTAFGRQRH